MAAHGFVKGARSKSAGSRGDDSRGCADARGRKGRATGFPQSDATKSAALNPNHRDGSAYAVTGQAGSGITDAAQLITWSAFRGFR